MERKLTKQEIIEKYRQREEKLYRESKSEEKKSFCYMIFILSMAILSVIEIFLYLDNFFWLIVIICAVIWLWLMSPFFVQTYRDKRLFTKQAKKLLDGINGDEK